MNLILLFPEDMTSDGRAQLRDRRLQHVREVHRAVPGDVLSVGMVNGGLGEGRVVSLSGEVLEMEVSFAGKAPAPLPATVILALPRPKVLRRVLFSLAVLGVKRIILINTCRVEKSYWQTPFLERDAVHRQFVLGLEQARDTFLPELRLARRFRPFVEDELPAILGDSLPLLCHPGSAAVRPPAPGRQVTVAIGPEGGFVPYEVDKLCAAGFDPVSLGQRVLNVETAVPALLAVVCGSGA